MDPIDRFTGEWAWLSNFWVHPMVIDGRQYQTVEHYFQASKALHLEEHEWVRNQPTARLAKQCGRRVAIKPNWNTERMLVMTRGIVAKFAVGSPLAKQLINTYPRELIEGNTWNDRFWGVCKGKGENQLGRMLMQRRFSLMHD